MKTKSLLFAALVSISFATTSCQKEDITPSSTSYQSEVLAEPRFENRKTLIDEKEAVTEENTPAQSTPQIENVAKPTPSQPKATPPTNIMQIDSDDVK